MQKHTPIENKFVEINENLINSVFCNITYGSM